MSKLEDDFILACGRADGKFVNMEDGSLGCYLEDPSPLDEFPVETQILLNKQDIIINSHLTVKDVEKIGHGPLTIEIKSKHSHLYVDYNSLGGKIE